MLERKRDDDHRRDVIPQVVQPGHLAARRVPDHRLDRLDGNTTQPRLHFAPGFTRDRHERMPQLAGIEVVLQARLLLGVPKRCADEALGDRSVVRLEPLGAKGQPGGLATENNFMLPLPTAAAQVGSP